MDARTGLPFWRGETRMEELDEERAPPGTATPPGRGWGVGWIIRDEEEEELEGGGLSRRWGVGWTTPRPGGGACCGGGGRWGWRCCRAAAAASEAARAWRRSASSKSSSILFSMVSQYATNNREFGDDGNGDGCAKIWGSLELKMQWSRCGDSV